MRFSLRRLQTFPLISLGFFALVVFILFAPLLFNTQGHVWSIYGNDMTTENIPWWKFGFGEWSKGNFALWNPHVFCGSPFFSNFNAGMLYPVNWVNLILPLQDGVNLVVVVDFILAGWFTALWVRHREVSPLGSIVAGTIYMFSGAYFMHLLPGHVSPLAAMSWAPLIFLSIDGIFDEPGLKWALLGMFAVAMQILSGFPQAVYDTALIGGLYTLLRLIGDPDRVEIAAWCLSIYVGGAMLGAIQMLTGMQTAAESVRQGGNSLEFAGLCSFPPANFLTLLAPCVLGDIKHSMYISHCFIWENCLFCGASTLILAGYGAVRGNPRQRLFAIPLILVSAVLAVGQYAAPVFHFLFRFIPLFSSFRSSARFNWFITLYVAMLAGIGFDLLIEMRPWRRGPVIAAFTAGCVIGLLALLCQTSAHSEFGLWADFVKWTIARPDYFNRIDALSPDQLLQTGSFAAKQLAISAGVLAVTAVVLGLLKLSAHFRFLLAAVTLVEMFGFAWYMNVDGPMYMDYPQAWLNIIHADNPQNRMLNPSLQFGNMGMVWNFDDLYGYDPVSLKRYTELMGMTQGVDPDSMNFMPALTRLQYPAIFQMLRCHHIFFAETVRDAQGQPSQVARDAVLPDPLRQVELVQGYDVERSREEVFAALRSPHFDARKMVVLESEPNPAPPRHPSLDSPGWASVVKSSTDWLEIRAHLTKPAILLVTDAYSTSWRARPLEPGPQASYTVMPANWALRAIPLAPGKHHLLLEYRPIGYTIGKWITILAGLTWLGAIVWLYRRGESIPVPAEPPEAAQVPGQ